MYLHFHCSSLKNINLELQRKPKETDKEKSCGRAITANFLSVPSKKNRFHCLCAISKPLGFNIRQETHFKYAADGKSCNNNITPRSVTEMVKAKTKFERASAYNISQWFVCECCIVYAKQISCFFLSVYVCVARNF